MSERHRDAGIFKQIRRGSIRGFLAASVSFVICPGDDLIAVGAALVPGGSEVVVHQGSLPGEDQYQLRITESYGKGRKLQNSKKPR